MGITIYHNPNWSKSRESVKILKKTSEPFIIINYCKIGLSINTINIILKKIGIEPIELIRKKDKTFVNLKLSDDQIKNKEFLVSIISKHPRIMERPIIINENKGVIGRPPENIYKILWI